MNAAAEIDSRTVENSPPLAREECQPGRESQPGQESQRGQESQSARATRSLDSDEAESVTAGGVAKTRAAESQKGTILRYRADRRSVTYVLAMFALHLAAFFLVSNVWVAAAWTIPLAVVSMFTAAINHHHQHFNTFHTAWLNRVYELTLSLQTGISPYGWVLHHNLGHHRNYLNQRPHSEPDESKWTRKDGSQMGRVEYTIDLVLNHQLDIFRVGRRYPKYLRAYLLMKIPVWAILGILFYVNPVNAFWIFLLPAFIALCHTSWATYEHHAGNYPTSHFDASMNRTSKFYNYMTCNLGFHTAHHKRPGVHWSLLPKLHEEIKDEIPPEMIQAGFW